ncbi:MAG: ImmA/IrrE family metallo-endopeptidase, partial [Gammaproteobacteria bacterium]
FSRFGNCIMAVERIEVKPAIIQWMFDRTGQHPEQEDAPNWTRMVAGWLEKPPTLKQLLAAANSAHIPFDYLLRDEPPPKAVVPLPDMRTVENREITEPSLDLLEVIHLCQWRQEWYKDYLHRTSNASCDFVGSASLEDEPQRVAATIRKLLQLPLIPPKGTWEQRVKDLTQQAAEKVGVLSMRMSMLGSHHRMLDPEEFRGFALADDRAPVICINGADSKGAQAFTFAHEFAHLMLGETALSGSPRPTEETSDVEQWCNAVAAEFLVPADDFLSQDASQVNELVRRYKASALVILIRLKTLNAINRQEFQQRYDQEKERIEREKKGFSVPHGRRRGQINEANPLLCRAVISSVREGRTTFKEAFSLLRVKNTKALQEVGKLVGAEL